MECKWFGLSISSKKLYGCCNVLCRLVAFNLGYLPGGDKKIKTESETTLLALEAAKKILARGGLISILAYVGHFGGR